MESEERIADLEIRFAHQEAALEELTRTILRLEGELADVRGELGRVQRLLREAAPAATVAPEFEPPPPHY